MNFNAEMKRIAEKNAGKKLLLHACCAPCSSTAIERLKDDFDLSVYFYNPNVDDAAEYTHRLEEEKRFCANFNLPVIDGGFSSQTFYSAVKGLENCAEGGLRCTACFKLRLFSAAEYAKNNGFDFFTTTLTLSPLKNAELLNEIGFSAAKEYGVSFLPSDFKKEGGYSRSIELSKEYGLYRQNYCGCSFSKRKT